MVSSLEIFIALRYLISKSRIRFINVIGLVSVTGITIGVAALLISLSVFNGFNGVVTDVLVGFDPHLRIEKKGGLNPADVIDVENLLGSDSRVNGYAPYISGKAMLVARSLNRVVFIRGVDERRIGDVSGLKGKMVLGSLSLNDGGKKNDIVIGLTLADRLGSVVGDDIVLISPYGFQSALSSLVPLPTEKFQITGIYESNNRDYDANYAYISLAAAKRIFNAEQKYTGLEVRLKDFTQSDKMKESLTERVPENFTISTWYDLHKNLYSVMKIERWSAYLFLCLIIVVATFNMFGALSMSVVEKKRDIGVLKSMGMRPNTIVRIFMIEGMLSGVIGTLLGIMIGLTVLFLQIKYQLFPLDTSVYIIPAIPVKILWTDFIAVSLASLGCSLGAAYSPARRAAAVSPSDVIRWE